MMNLQGDLKGFFLKCRRLLKKEALSNAERITKNFKLNLKEIYNR